MLWEGNAAGQHRFRPVDTENARILENTLEIHLLELPRYTLTEKELAGATPVERWIFLLRHAQNYDLDRLRRLFPEVAFQQAIQSIVKIALKTEDKQMYDTREKAARDHQWLINGARNEGLEEGMEKGMEKGTLMGTIRTCQSILKMPESSQEALLAKSLSDLQSMANELQSALRSRVV